MLTTAPSNLLSTPRIRSSSTRTRPAQSADRAQQHDVQGEQEHRERRRGFKQPGVQSNVQRSLAGVMVMMRRARSSSDGTWKVWWFSGRRWGKTMRDVERLEHSSFGTDFVKRFPRYTRTRDLYILIGSRRVGWKLLS